MEVNLWMTQSNLKTLGSQLKSIPVARLWGQTGSDNCGGAWVWLPPHASCNPKQDALLQIFTVDPPTEPKH